MSTLIIHPASTSTHDSSQPRVRQVANAAPFTWLRNGWADLVRGWPASLGLGLLFAGIGYLLTNHAWGHAHLTLFFTSGFLLVAPFLALGFYGLSRRLESQSGASLFAAMQGNLNSIGMYALTLAFILSVWERISAILVGLFYQGGIAMGDQISLTSLVSGQNLEFTIAWTLAGGILAALVFALSLVTLPLLMERKVDFITAMLTSLRAVRLNPLPMLIWAAAIVVLVVIGEALWFAGLAVILPLLGHATWHAYRDLVAAE